MLIFLRLVMVLVFLVCSSSCSENAKIADENAMVKSKPISSKPMVKQLWQQVSVTFQNFEGGFYGLVTAKGEKLLPMNLPEKYKVENLKIKITFKEINESDKINCTAIVGGDVFPFIYILDSIMRKANGYIYFLNKISEIIYQIWGNRFS